MILDTEGNEIRRPPGIKVRRRASRWLDARRRQPLPPTVEAWQGPDQWAGAAIAPKSGSKR